MDHAKPAPTLIITDSTLSLHSGNLIDNPTEYPAALGSLEYLTINRPDVAFDVNKLSEFMHMPHTAHWSAFKRLLQYLASGTLEKGITIHHDSPLTLHTFSDVDWVGNKDDIHPPWDKLYFLDVIP